MPDYQVLVPILAETVGLEPDASYVPEIAAALGDFLRQGELILTTLAEVSDQPDTILPAPVYDAEA